jgi:signal transduction histidine kinase
VSDAPVTGRKPLARDVPLEWIDAVLVAVTEIEPSADLERRVSALVDAAASALPSCAFGVRLPGACLVVRRSPGGGGAGAGDPTRLFPDLASERLAPIFAGGDPALACPSGEDLAMLHVASDDEKLLFESPALDALVNRLALALRASIRQAHANALLRDQVIQSDKLASLGQIAAGVVHELNNPLTSILAYSDYLRRKGERAGTDPTDLDRLARINEAADRILRFSRDLIAYSRPSTERPGPVSIHDVIDRALSFCEHVLDKTGVLVERSFGDVAPVLGVASQLTQVFVNLFTNAAQAMQEEGGTLRIATAAIDDGSSVRVTIRDDGHGIHLDHLPRIFDPFFTTKTDGTGTGLGLSIVQSIIDAHGGRIRVDAGEPRGATFHVDLPVAASI